MRAHGLYKHSFTFFLAGKDNVIHMRSYVHPYRRGFNLIEAAIVLGVVGLVIGGIWVAATAVNSNWQNSRTQQQIVQIVANSRSLFNRQSLPNADVTSALIAAGAIPSDMVQGSVARNLWNGTITVSTQDVGRIIVSYSAVPRSNCINLLQRVSANDAQTGLSLILAGACAFGGSMSLADASTACSASTQSISFTYSQFGEKQIISAGGCGGP
jgi:hypothetical protein